MDNQLLEDKILKLPEEIKKQQVDILSHTLKIEEKKKLSKITEMIVSAKVAADKALTNEIMRKAAINELLLNDGSYQGLLTDANILDGQLRVEQIELDYLHNLFRAFITVAQMHGVK